MSYNFSLFIDLLFYIYTRIINTLKSFSIDGNTCKEPAAARMCNDSLLHPNAKIQVVGNVNASLCIFAKYTEIRYNYGDQTYGGDM